MEKKGWVIYLQWEHEASYVGFVKQQICQKCYIPNNTVTSYKNTHSNNNLLTKDLTPLVKEKSILKERVCKEIGNYSTF